ncbi:hypothetical protein PputUW4_04620 [Pseudomonas sp. UW4]|jgi:hypothetical protein|nr:hypothetical protein PputUW4_04620 [Pseudomonas sp. UW4]
MRIDMIITTGRETGRFSEKPLVRTLRLSPHQANHGYLTRLLPGLFFACGKVLTGPGNTDHHNAGGQTHDSFPGIE